MKCFLSAAVLMLSVWLVSCGKVEPKSSDALPVLGGPPTTLFVLSSDITKKGHVRFLDLANGKWVGEQIPTNADAIARFLPSFGELWVVNRWGADNLQPIQKDLLRWRAQRKVGDWNELQDVVDLDLGRVLVSSHVSSDLIVLDSEFNEDGRFSLKDLETRNGTKLVDADGSPEPSTMWKNGKEIWVQLRRLDRTTPNFDPLEHGYIAVLDTQTRTVSKTLELAFSNPTSDSKLGPDGKLYVAQNGFNGASSKLDGGIEKWDPATYASLGVVVTEKTLGGDLVDFEILSPTLGVAIVANPRSRLVRFNPATGENLGELSRSNEYAYFQLLADHARGFVYLVDRTASRPRIRMWNAASGVEHSQSIDPGLPASQIGFMQ